MAELLSALVFVPLVGALLVAFLPAEEQQNLKAAGLVIALVVFGLSLFAWTGFDLRASGYQFVQDLEWIKPFGIRYHVGVDGISLVLIMLTTFLMPIVLLGAWTAIESRVKEFVIAMLVLEAGMIGAFVSLDLFLFYVFWEAMLIPMYFIIGIWGGQRRIYAAVKFFLFTFAASLLMLIAVLYVAHAGGTWDFSLEHAIAEGGKLDRGTQLYLFSAFALAFAVKVPMFPVHTWLPDAHTEAPTPGSVILAGVMLKLGVYGFIRFAFPMFPQAAMAAAPVIGWLATIGIVYGAVAAWVQTDVKRLVAYSSVSHLGFCMLGLAAMTQEGVGGAVYQMLAHGISTGALFMLVGIVYERRHTRLLADYGGIARKVPVFAFFFVMISMASAGLPTLCGFPGEFLILSGTFTGGAPLGQVLFQGDGWVLRLHQVLAIISASGVILAAVYLLWMVQKVLFGPLQDPANESLEDMRPREVLVLIPFAVMAVVMGLAPSIFTSRFEPAVAQFVNQVHAGGGQGPYAPDPGQKRLALQGQDARPAGREDAARPGLRLRPAFDALPGRPEVIMPNRLDGRAPLQIRRIDAPSAPAAPTP